MTPVTRSLFDAEALGRAIGGTYGLDVTESVLVRSFVNDVYRIGTTDGAYALKVYRHDCWSRDEIAWEQDLVRHLHTHGVAVPPVVATLDGRFIGTLDAPEGLRTFALTEYVTGRKPGSPFDAELYRSFGRLTGRVHFAGDSLATGHPRRPNDLGRALDEPLAAVLPMLAGDDAALISELAAKARDRVETLSRGPHGLDWGVCHGDVTLDNLHVADSGLVLHDFDSAAPGWRAHDLTGVAATPLWDAFVDGYTDERPLADADVDAMPWLGVIARIANLHFHLVDKPAWRGNESLSEGWAAGELTELRAAADRLG
jgi:Ser/Thr protein kinase RdoA (MazF antagonist)